MMKRVEMILSLLDPLAIEELIHRPINNAAEAFDYTPPNPITHDTFNTLIDRFTKHIYDFANLSYLGPRAEYEGIWLLENNYRREEFHGYEDAYADTLNNEYGIGFILEAITEIIREIEHQKHIKSVLIQYVDPTDRQVKARVAEDIHEMLKAYLPEYISSLSPYKLASELETHISTWINSYSIIKSILS